ncbi:MAG: YeeE/YedE thiosulfate transporter family protein [Betaproteobacteria bacterium]|nr:YeeE/YedE thiosulfate transporter family protein [Betaproteobacteria bacterium]
MSTSDKHGNPQIKPFWPPLAAGIALGLILLLTFVLSGHGLGASGAATDVVAGVGLKLAPEATKANGYLGPMVADGSPIGSWMTWEILGVAIGALVAAFMGGRFRVQLDGACSVGTPKRLISTLAGGFLAGFGARIAGGCTSGVGLSGSAALGIAAFVFLALFFATGMIVSRLVKGV